MYLIRVRVKPRGWPAEVAEGATTWELFQAMLRIGGHCLLDHTNSAELRAQFARVLQCMAMENMYACGARLQDTHQVCLQVP
jgi:hypothetical protein